MIPVNGMQRRRTTVRRSIGVIVLFALVSGGVVQAPSAVASAPGPRSRAAAQRAESERLWGALPSDAASVAGSTDIRVRHPRTLTLDRAGMRAFLADAPHERANRGQPALIISLPAPRGGFERFTVQESPVMQPRLAKQHPRIKTYAGRGLDDPSASIRFAMTPLGFSASVRGRQGMWYIDPISRTRRDVYQSYFKRDLANRHGTFVYREAREIERSARADLPLVGTPAPSAAGASIGAVLRTYRLALTTDPSYAAYWGPANVTAGKVLLVNRVDQVYEQDLAIRMVLVANNDLLNLNTAALATGADGPCGATACFTAGQLSTCDSPTLTRNDFVAGQLIGEGNYDIGHVALGMNGGGIASVGVIGRHGKAEGCTGISQPDGDGYAVDYVAHEMGHQFGADHTFNGTLSNCGGGNRSSVDAVEPGGGSTIMAYAGICGNDDLQAHSDPYFSQKSFDEITAYVTSNRNNQSTEVQSVALTGFDGTDSFTLRYNGSDSAPIVRGTNYSQAGIKAAIEGISGWPAGLTATVAGFWGGTFGDNGFQVTLSGTVASSGNASQLGVTNPNGVSGFVGVTTRGGPVQNQGYTVTGTGNSPPDVTAPTLFSIPARTPFALTGSATDPDNDTVTYLWEQNDVGVTSTALRSNTKLNGPLFRVFGTTNVAALYDPHASPSPGLNATTTDPTRVFPDMAQILANNTNAETGVCPTSGSSAVIIECFSEFLPTSSYAGPMHFRLTARDGHTGGGGVASAETTVSVASGAGPFLVTSQNAAVSYPGPSSQTVTWDVAGTTAAPVSAANVAIMLSTNGGSTFPITLAASTPNDGSETITIPNVITTHARIQVKAVGNIFFDVSNADFTIDGTISDQTISFAPLADKSYGDPDFTVSATASSGLPVSFSASGNCTRPTATTIHIVSVGSCTVTATQAGDGSYNPAPPVSRTFQIAKGNQTISFAPLATKSFGDPDFAVSATSSSGLVVSFGTGGSCTNSGAAIHLTGVGSCTVTANQIGNPNWNPAPSVDRTFQITARATTTALASKPKAKVKHGKKITLTATVSAGGRLPAGSVTFYQDGVALGTVALTSGKAVFKFTAALVGTHVMRAEFIDPAGNYATSSGTKNLKIT